MAELDNAQVRQWAVKGAEQRLLEIAAEASAIYQTFPELRERGGGNQAGKRGGGGEAAAAPARGQGRGRANMSAAQRKAVSERMRKYWAARREGTVGGTSSGTAKRGRGSAGASRGDGAQAAGGRRGPRKMSAAARKRISDAQKKRWAESRKAKS